MDTENLLKLLNDNNVDYVIIGATAFPIHGYSRSTLDVDIFIRPTRLNAVQAWNALKEFGYDMTDVSVEEMITKKILIRQYALETDIHPFVKGVNYDEVDKHKVKGKIGKTTSSFASLNDLIKMKNAAARPKDIDDLRYLLKLKERNNSKSKEE